MIEKDFAALFFSQDSVTGSYGSVTADDSPITSIASVCGSRIYPLVLPTSPTLPAITYSFIGGSTHATFDSPGTQKYRVEVNCWGTSYGDAITLRAAVITALNGYLDSNMSIQLIQSTDFFEHDLLQYRAMVEFYIYTQFQ